jgi:RNA polymerase sigma-70 factor (ECF subfamily)
LLLYRELGERIFRLAHRMTLDKELAKDVVHDTFVIAFSRSGQFEGRGDISGWIFRIAANLVREGRRTNRRRMELLERESRTIGNSIPDTSGRITTRLVLEEALDRLPEGYRAILLLHEVDGYTHPEIAEMMGLAVGTSRARLARAKAELRKTLSGKV